MARRKVAHVDTDNGWFKLANELCEGIFQAGLGDTLSVYGMLLRNTYGDRGKKSCEWSVRIAAEECRISRTRAERAWKQLLESNMVICEREPKGKIPGIFGPNKNVETWIPVSSHQGHRISNLRPHTGDAKPASCVLTPGTQENGKSKACASPKTGTQCVLTPGTQCVLTPGTRSGTQGPPEMPSAKGESGVLKTLRLTPPPPPIYLRQTGWGGR